MASASLPSSCSTHERRHVSCLPTSAHTTTATQPFFVSFNQDRTCLACGTSTGFRIFSLDPFREIIRRDFEIAKDAFPDDQPGTKLSLPDSEGEVYMLEMFFKSNVVAFVGVGSSPRYPPSKVILWDDREGRSIGEFMFLTKVRGVRLTNDRIVVVLEYKIYVYKFANLALLHQLGTLANPNGLCALSSASTSCVLACPGLHCGEVRLELFGSKKTRFLQAHTSAIACLSLCHNGSLLATSSEKGTLIRIFSTFDCTQLQELRRGADSAKIYSLAFPLDCDYLVVSSNKGTIHLFTLRFPWYIGEQLRAADVCHKNYNAPAWNIEELIQDDAFHIYSKEPGGHLRSISTKIQLQAQSWKSATTANWNSSLSFIKGVLPKYLSWTWSFAKFHLPEETHAIATFGAQKNTVVVACTNGSYYKCSFDPVNGGEMLQQEHAMFIKLD